MLSVSLCRLFPGVETAEGGVGHGSVVRVDEGVVLVPYWEVLKSVQFDT